MQNLTKSLKSYLQDTLDVSVDPVQWEGAKRLPFFLRDLYRFYTFNLMNVRCLIMAVRGKEEQTPAVIRKHFDQIGNYWEGGQVYLAPQVTAYNRKRLIQQKVPFIVPGNQMYLPMLGIDLREHFRKSHSGGSLLSPSTQTVVLYALNHAPIAGELTPSCLANHLGYTVMTLTRAFNELEAAGLAEIRIQGRERKLRFNAPRRDLWEKAKAVLRTPVRKRVYLKHGLMSLPGCMAGLSALAQYTLLAPPANPVIAMGASDFRELKKRNDIAELNGPGEPGVAETEIWSYTPGLFSNEQGLVDPFSLYLSLREIEDERVESALTEMIEAIRW